MVAPASSINVREQLGFESSFGAGGATAYALQSTMIEPGDELKVSQFAAQGHRFDTVAAINEHWSALAISGPVLYSEYLLLLENAFGTVSPTTPSGAVTARKRVYSPPTTGLITPRSWVGQFGDPSDNINTYGGGLVTDIGMKADREKGAEIDGAAGIAQIIATGSAFTASPTSLPIVPVLGSHINYYLDTTGAALGTTQITDEMLDSAWTMKGFKGPRWVSDRAQASYKGSVDLKPTSEVQISMAESSVTRAIVASLLIGQIYFLRVNAQGLLVDNLQTVTITGTPTGGTFTLTYKGQTTAGIAYNANAAAVQAALVALSTIGSGNVSVTGGPGPGTAWTVAFIGALAQDATLMTTSGAGLTGGTTPASAVAAAPFYYLLNTDVAFRLTKIDKYSDGSGAGKGVYMRKLTGVIAEDSTWGNALQITSQTGIASV